MTASMRVFESQRRLACGTEHSRAAARGQILTSSAIIESSGGPSATPHAASGVLGVPITSASASKAVALSHGGAFVGVTWQRAGQFDACGWFSAGATCVRRGQWLGASGSSRQSSGCRQPQVVRSVCHHRAASRVTCGGRAIATFVCGDRSCAYRGNPADPWKTAECCHVSSRRFLESRRGGAPLNGPFETGRHSRAFGLTTAHSRGSVLL